MNKLREIVCEEKELLSDRNQSFSTDLMVSQKSREQ